MSKKWIAVLIILFLFGCHKDPSVIPDPPVPPGKIPPPPASGLAVTVTIDDSKPQYMIPSNFVGLSYETKILAESPEILNENNKVLIQLIKNLGAGLLRIGGDTSDETFWTGNVRASNTGTDSLTTTDVDRLAAFSNAIGWPVLFGLNMGKFDVATAVNEAKYVSGRLQNNVYAFQAGNEPDVYHLFGLRDPNYSINDYTGEFEQYKNAIQAAVPTANFAGPGSAYNTDFISGFAEAEHANASLFDVHYYVTGPASSPSISYQDILSTDLKLNYTLEVITEEATKFNMPYRVTECNSVYGGGKAGVSDIFASALWALDFMWTVASNGGKGINFHGGNKLIYSPITIENGVITARPEYYAMLAFQYGSAGVKTIAATQNSTIYNCTSYVGLKSDGTRMITLINKDNVDLAFTVQTGSTISDINITRLTAPAITSTTGTTFGSNAVNSDGTFTSVATAYYVNKKSFVVNMPAGSAAVISAK
jgi:hypothetical protein